MTEAKTLTLTDFLLARIAGDERDARGALGSAMTDDALASGWGTERVLVECEAKRRILHQHVQMSAGQPLMADYEGADQQCVSCGYAEEWEMTEYGPTFPCPTLLALALPYADHPDFREEWRLGVG